MENMDSQDIKFEELQRRVRRLEWSSRATSLAFFVIGIIIGHLLLS